MKITEPKLENREALPYAGIRSQVSMQDLPNIIPQHIGEVAEWLGQQGIEPAGPPIIRYYVCPTVADGAARVDVAVGWPVAKSVTGTDRIEADALPAGRYASLIYTGVENGVPANGVLIEWAIITSPGTVGMWKQEKPSPGGWSICWMGQMMTLIPPTGKPKSPS
jgi:effector-binding domain-containing protein